MEPANTRKGFFIFLRSLVFWVLVVVIFLVYAPFVWLRSLGKKKPEAEFLRGAKNFARLMIFFSGARIRLEGLDNQPPAVPHLVIANHQSAFDIFLLLAYLPPDFYFTIKEELFRVPLFRWFLKKAGYISLARTNALASSRALQRGITFITQGKNLLIFPEGTRSYAHQMGEFKRGFGEVILETLCPVWPVAIDGSYKVMGRGSFYVRPSQVRLVFLPAKRLSIQVGATRRNSSASVQEFLKELQEEFRQVLG